MLSYIFYFWQYIQIDWILILARFVDWILNWFFNRRCLWRCCRGRLNCFLMLGQRASACTFNHLFVRLCLGVCLLCTRLSKHFSAFHSVVIVCEGDIRLLFKLLLKFRNALKHTHSWSSLACNQNIKEDIPTALEVFLCFETKQNDINRSSMKTFMQRASNIRGRTSYVQCLKITQEHDYLGYKTYEDSLSYLDNLLTKQKGLPNLNSLMILKKLLTLWIHII